MLCNDDNPLEMSIAKKIIKSFVPSGEISNTLSLELRLL
jgi:hypothetical protein